MTALESIKGFYLLNVHGKITDEFETKISWQLTKENGQECTDDDQTKETIEKLYELLK